jgi:RND family efflux transporter MFP subunit
MTSLIAADAAPISVSIIKPEKRDVSRWLRLPGSVEADAEVTLYAKVSGYLKDFNSDVGDVVKPGQLIGRLDAPELEQDVKMAEAQLASAQSELEAANTQLERTKLRKEDIDAKEAVLGAELEKANAEATRIKIECARTEKLFSTNAATEQERDNNQYWCQTQVAAAKAAQNRIEALKPERALWQKDVDVSKAAVESARKKVALAEAALGRARVWFGYTDLTVPQLGVHVGASAVITKRFVSNGDLVPGGTGARSGIQPIVTLQVMDPVRVVADVPESDSVCIQPGSGMLIAFHAHPGEKPVSAKVTRTSNSLWATTRTMRIEVDLPNQDGRIKPGMMSNLEISLDCHKTVWAVPSSAVVTDKQGAAVFVAEGGKAKRMPLKTGFQDHGWTEVIDPGISEATPIVKDAQAVSDGAVIEIKP